MPNNETGLVLPWGPTEEISLRLPERWRSPNTFVPDLSGRLEAYSEALERSLDAPLGGATLERLVKSGSRVAIVVDDPSRWTPVREALPVVLSRLHALGVATDAVSISVGVGRHHAVSEVSMRKRLGDEIVARYRCFSPPVDELSRYADLGTTPEGVPVRVFRPVVEADVRLLIGSVLPHLQAGFGGGYKLMLPGCSHRSTLAALHRHGLEGDAGRLIGGDPNTNPMRRAIGAAAALLGPCFSISHVLGSAGDVLRVESGSPDLVQDALSSEVRRRFRAPTSQPVDVLVASNFPWPGDPMQSFKVLLNHIAACRVGGVLVGFFWADAEEIDRSLPSSVIGAFARLGKAGGWAVRGGMPVAERVAKALGNPSQFMIRWGRELVVDRRVLVYCPPLRERFGRWLGSVQLFAEQCELWTVAQSLLGAEPPRSVRVFPIGGLSYVSANVE